MLLITLFMCDTEASDEIWQEPHPCIACATERFIPTFPTSLLTGHLDTILSISQHSRPDEKQSAAAVRVIRPSTIFHLLHGSQWV
jgi:hypothetical protein